ncbi:MAG: dTMP kinase [Thiotrichales bacterium]|nr:MAG: dTMP kinase [Thiotrichales bacterium]
MLGKFIVFEGIDGSGKTTNLKFVAELLRQKGHEVLETREPGGTVLGLKIREILLDNAISDIDLISELLLLFAARRQHIQQVILPALVANKYVLCDRFTMASFAYQGGGRGISESVIATIANIVQDDLQPSHTFLFDLPVAMAALRVHNRGVLDRFELESRKFFTKVRNKYLEIAHSSPNEHTIIDATKSLYTIQQYLLRIINNAG